MAQVDETIPEALAAEVEAASSWLNRERSADFAVTGIVDPEASLAQDPAAGPRELQLILCGHDGEQDVCLRERFGVRTLVGGFEIALLADPPPGDGAVEPKLDPPPGARRQWLDGTRSWCWCSIAASGDRRVATSCVAT